MRRYIANRCLIHCLCGALAMMHAGVATSAPEGASTGAPPKAAPPTTSAVPMTFETAFAKAEQQSKAKHVEQSITLFEQAVALTQDPNRKAQALGEISVLALSLSRYRASVKAACDALELVSGAARGSHLYNLGRVALAVQDLGSAAALYQSSVALRPNATVSAQLGRMGNVTATPYPGPDAGKGFCQAALSPKESVSPEFVRLAKDIANQRKEKVTSADWWPLGLRGELIPVAMLCDNPAGGNHGAWLIEADAQHRYLVAFDSLDGRASLDACNTGKDRIYVGHGGVVALSFSQGHRGGYEDYRVGVRKGSPVIIYTESLDDVRASDHQEAVDFDKRGGPYKSPQEFGRVILLDKKGMTQVGLQDQ